MKVLPVIYFALFIVHTYAQPVNPEWNNDPLYKKLNGKVASIKQTIEPGREHDNFTQTFDNDNRIIKTAFANSSQQFVYDSTSGLFKTQIALDRKGRELSKTSYTYNQNKELVLQKNEGEGGQNYNVTIDYVNGKVASQSIVHADGASNNSKRRYDAKGKLIESIEDIPTLMSMASHQRSAYEYDKLNRISKEENYEGNPEQLLSTRTFKYDSKGNLIETVLKNPTPNKYDYVMRYTYDANNNLTEYVTDVGKNDLDDHLKYEYQFDSQKNLINKRVYRKGELAYEVKREITYR